MLFRLIAITYASLMLPSFACASTPQRIITLAPHATEMAFAAGLGEKIIAVSERSDYPPQAQQLETVSNYQGIKLERILALKPDLVIAWPAGNPAKALAQLEQFGIEVYFSHTNSLEDIANNLEALAAYSDDPSTGRAAAAKFRQQLTELKLRYDTETPVRYFYQLSDKPLITVADGHWPAAVFQFCGGENSFQQANAPYPQVSVEQVILRQPEAMFTSPHATDYTTVWQPWQADIPALKFGHFWSLNPDWLNRPTPRTVLALEQVCQHLDTVRQHRQ
ncbi:vitamin B12 ABC transporter substrate-binding protein BtuF [Vibrio sp. SM6]|uniref:Vitamin B12-binding protein n=1 Tax=Vibrio agarilyticus TaxID=2726741 RepID=A0A7X8YGD0_9VIBR|nr:vitamin B12 ABC transporter substrate-binding protein BtuF [Vibrio agarilyticus]NLS12281.1 vitamin B12 ABC transporter substrate-binding protein BtuF [Vibrio agarilyticus]